MLKNIFHAITNSIFPKVCCNCKTPGKELCQKCKKQLKPYPEICSLCNKYSQGYNICPSCKIQQNLQLKKIIIGFYYNSIIKQLILNLKYRHRYETSGFLSKRLQFLIDIYLPNCNKENTLLMGIPSHRYRRYIIKGYNQSQLLAKKLAKYTGIPYESPIKKIKNTKSQVKLNKQQRAKNLKNCFIFQHLKNFTNIQYIIIVDDITTTGSSLNEIAKTIHKHYSNITIYGIVLAKK